MSILTTIETDVKDGIEAAETVVKIAWGVVSGTIEADAKMLIGDASSLFAGLLPAEYAILKGLISTAVTDVTTGDLADVETAVLNAASAAEQLFVSTMGSGLLKAFIAMVAAL
jgi:hypothetical protein